MSVIWFSKKVGWVILIAILSFTCTLHYIYQISLYKSTPYRNHANFQHLGDYVSLSTFNLDGTYDPMLSTLSIWNLYWKWYLETQAVISVYFCLVSVLSQYINCTPTVWEYCRWSTGSYFGQILLFIHIRSSGVIKLFYEFKCV